MPSLASLISLTAYALLSVATPISQEDWSGPHSGKPSPTGWPVQSGQPKSPSTAPPYLNDLAKREGKLWFGTATDQPGTGEDNNTAYQQILNNTHIFGQLTPANGMKFVNTEPEQGVFDFSKGQVVVDIARDHGKLVRCHNLVWQSQVSDFVINGTWTKDSLTAVMENHIKTVVTHYGDACYSWDVVNEALDSQGGFTNESIWEQVIGPDYFFLAFQFAQEAVEATGKDIKLYYNDYGIESPGNKTNAAYNLVKELQSRGIRIDGVGLESHFEVGGTPSTADQIATKQGFVDLGVEVVVTELDIRFTALPPNSTGYAMQAQNYYDTVASCIQVDKCVGITVWDFDDEYSWIPSTFTGEGDGDLYNVDLTRKPAYQACADAIVGKPCSVC